MYSKTKKGRAEYWQKYRATKSPYIKKSCEVCGEYFKQTSNSQKRCIKCKILICEYCGNHFSSKNNYQRFCSLSCRALGHPEVIKTLIKNKGKKPRTYHLRHRDKRGNAFDVDWRKAIFKRDNYTCQSCAKNGGIQAHHIKPYKLCPELRYELSNGVTLCIDCHKKTDTYGWQSYWKSQIMPKKELSQEVFEFK